MTRTALLLSLLAFANSAQAHKGHSHSDYIAPTLPQSTNLEASLKTINEAYKREVKPIFQRSCFDCHSQSPRLPWYHSLPFVHGLLERDMKEAKVHLDFSSDFPFQGHGSPQEDLDAIADSIRDGSMPPFRYRIMHSNSVLSESDRAAIQAWVEKASSTLKSKP